MPASISVEDVPANEGVASGAQTGTLQTGSVPSPDTPNLNAVDLATVGKTDSGKGSWRQQRKESMGRIVVKGPESPEPPPKSDAGRTSLRPKFRKKKVKHHVTGSSTLMDLDDSHVPDGATPFEKQMHARIKAMDRDGDGKVTIQERPPLAPRIPSA
jgi:hypothetical protein